MGENHYKNIIHKKNKYSDNNEHHNNPKCKCSPKCSLKCKCAPKCKCGTGDMADCKCGPKCSCAPKCKCGPGCKCKTGDMTDCKCGSMCMCGMDDGISGKTSVSMKNIKIIKDVDKIINIDHKIFRKITINIKENKTIDLQVDTIGRPDEVLRIPHVYEHYDINIPLITNTVNTIHLEFRVPLAWYRRMNYLPDTTVLNHWIDGVWIEEKVTLIRTDNTFHYFGVNVKSFSYYNISAQLNPNYSNPGGIPHYYGPWPNWANSPLPRGMIGKINIENGGEGYSNDVSVFIEDYYYGDVKYLATAVPTIVNGTITDIVIKSPGSGYSVPVVTIVDNKNIPKVEAVVSANIAEHTMDQICRVEIIDGGSGYVNPQITVTDTYVHQLSDTAVLDLVVRDRKIINVVIRYPGHNYINPVIQIVDESGSGAKFSIKMGGYIAGIKKFIDPLRLFSSSVDDNLQPERIPIAVPDTKTYPGDEYYELGIVESEHRFHKDLPPTRIRGYVQIVLGSIPDGLNPNGFKLLYNDGTPIMYQGVHVKGITEPRYLGPLIHVEENRTIRIKFHNLLPIGDKGKLFLPVDQTIMGAGMNMNNGEMYPENRSVIHLHGNNSPWINDGNPHQWFTPADEQTTQKKGVSVIDVPDMPAPGDGAVTFYFSNTQSSRLLFYHDHAYGLTRLNVYAGEIAPYDIQSMIEKDLIRGTNNTGENPHKVSILPKPIYLVIQDKTFVDADAIGFQDPTWNNGTGNKGPDGRITEYVTGDMWYPHVYMNAQNPFSPDGLNQFGRWHYAPWFWPPATIEHMPIDNPFYDPKNPSPYEPPLIPDLPDLSSPGEAFMDTMTVNGTAYPYMEVDPKVTRFKILNGSDDRFINIQWYVADPLKPTEVRMVDAMINPLFPETWPTDGREGGVPDPTFSGPDFVQIGNECGFLPNPVSIPSQPITWNADQTAFSFGNVENKSLLLGTAERADVLVDFSAYAGQTLILYNDAPAAFPALDNHYNYYTDCPDRMDMGGAPSTHMGYGPNIRTIMQIRVRPDSNSKISEIKINSNGNCYKNPSVVLVGGTNSSKASAVARGHIDAVSILSSGFGYVNPIINVDMTGQPVNSLTPIFSPVLYMGMIIGVDVKYEGSGLGSAPILTISDDRGIGAVINCSIVIDSISVIDGGMGYTSPPKIVINDTEGHGCSASAYLTSSNPSLDMQVLKDVFTHTDVHKSIFELTHDPIIVPMADYGPAYGRNDLPTEKYIRIDQQYHEFDGLDGNHHNIYLEPKALQDEMGEVFDPYGRMMVMQGLEVPFTSANNQNFIMYPYVSPPVDIVSAVTVNLKDPNVNILLSQIALTETGTQIWRITHNGVDSHTIHIHLFNAQLINRIGWDNTIYPPDANELGYKETFIINPLQNTYFAFRSIVDTSPSFFNKIPNSIRLLDQTMPEGMPLVPPVGEWADPNGDPVVDPNGNEQILNHYVNHGWEYVYHCHILAHEEMDMMHTLCVAIPPAIPSNFKLMINGTGSRIAQLTWTPGSINATSYVIEKSADSVQWSVIATVSANTTSYSDVIGFNNNDYFYRIKAINVVGDTQIDNFPTITRESAYTDPEYTGIPDKPYNIQLTVSSLNEIIAQWTNTPYTKNIRIQLATSKTFFVLSLVANILLSGNENRYVFDPNILDQLTTYYFRMQSYGNSSDLNGSGYTDPLSVTTNLLPPSNLTINKNLNSVRFIASWTNNTSWPTNTRLILQYTTDPNFKNFVTTVNNIGRNTTTYLSPILSANTWYVQIWARSGSDSSAHISGKVVL